MLTLVGVGGGVVENKKRGKKGKSNDFGLRTNDKSVMNWKERTEIGTHVGIQND